MKNLLKLGTVLNKTEQQKISGGRARACGFCATDSNCDSCNITAYIQQEWRCLNHKCVGV